MYIYSTKERHFIHFSAPDFPFSLLLASKKYDDGLAIDKWYLEEYIE